MPLRAPDDGDWPEILRVANQALPGAVDGNAAWVANRRGFDGTTRSRRQYIAAAPDGRIASYGAIEEDAERGRFRLFVVMSPERLAGGLGDLVYARLLRDLDELGARAAWMREQADDRSIQTFASERGFRETQRFTFEGVEIVVLELVVRPTSNLQPSAGRLRRRARRTRRRPGGW